MILISPVFHVNYLMLLSISQHWSSGIRGIARHTRSRKHHFCWWVKSPRCPAASRRSNLEDRPWLQGVMSKRLTSAMIWMCVRFAPALQKPSFSNTKLNMFSIAASCSLLELFQNVAKKQSIGDSCLSALLTSRVCEALCIL